MNHLEAWRAYCEARTEHEERQKAATEAEKQFRIAEARLVDAMIEDDVGTWSDTALGCRISTRKTFDLKVNAGNVTDVERWLVERYGDSETYKRMTLDKSAVRAKVLEDVENGVPLEEFPPFLDAAYRYGISVTGWNKP